MTLKIRMLEKVIKTRTKENKEIALTRKHNISPYSFFSKQKLLLNSKTYFKKVNKSPPFNSPTNLEALPGFDKFIIPLSKTEREDIVAFLKNYDILTLFQIFTILDNSQIYQKLKSKSGLDAIKTVYNEVLSKFKNENKKNLLLSDNYPMVHKPLTNSNICNSNDISGNSLIPIKELNDECEFYFCFKDLLNINELNSCDIFNLFKYNYFFTFGITQFVLLVYYFLAIEYKELEDFINTFGDEIFRKISADEKTITLSRMKILGSIAGITEKKLNDCALELNYELNTDIDVKKFKDFYLLLGKYLKNSNDCFEYSESIIDITEKKSNLNISNVAKENEKDKKKIQKRHLIKRYELNKYISKKKFGK